MAKLIILCGLPGSGKSSYAKDFKRTNNTYFNEEIIIHSSDTIREELFGDAGSQEDNGKVFELMHKRVRADLSAGKTVIYDATNITRKTRKSAIACANPVYDTIECHIVWAEPDECIRRDSLRDRTVGPKVIDKMLRRWQSPWYDEGFNNIEIHLNQGDFNQIKYVAMMTANLHIPHENPHHQLDIWEHCMQAYNNIVEKYKDAIHIDIDFNSLATAAFWHDIGKPYTKFFKSGETIAHYYDHHCVGGYLAYGLFLNHLFMSSSKTDICFISWMITNHMEPFFNSNYYQKLSPHLKQCIDILHEADLNAH
jgi:predicted kinase